MSFIEQKLRSLGYELPPVPTPIGSYVPCVIHGDVAYISGQVSKRGADIIKGKVGGTLNIDEAHDAARFAAIAALSIINHYIPEERFERIIKVCGFVNADAAFEQIPQVINGASDLLSAVLGDRGIHARSAVGCVSLPMGAAVEIDVIVGLKS